MTDLVPAGSPRELATYFKESGLFPDLQSEAQAYVKIVAGQELGLGPLASVSGLNVIKGKITFSANLLASMVKKSPTYDYRVTAHNERGCRIAFYQDGTEIGESTFTMADAERAGLGGSNWSRYPKAMLFARALTQGVRWYCPDVTAGAPAYTPDELSDTVGHPETVDPRVRGDVPMPHDPADAPDSGPTDRRVDRLAQLVDEFGFDDEQRAGLRDFVRAGGSNAVETAIVLLEEGNPTALFAGMEYEAESVDGEVVR